MDLSLILNPYPEPSHLKEMDFHIPPEYNLPVPDVESTVLPSLASCAAGNYTPSEMQNSPYPPLTSAGVASAQPTLFAVDSPSKRPARSSVKDVNYKVLANGQTPRQKRDFGSTIGQHIRSSPRFSASNCTPASVLSFSNTAEDSRQSRSVSITSTDDRASETPDSQRPTTGGKSPVLMDELRGNLIKKSGDNASTSSLSPAPEDLEDTLPAMGKGETTSSAKKEFNLRFKQRTFKSQDSLGGVDTPTEDFAPQNGTSHITTRKRRRGKVTSYDTEQAISFDENQIIKGEEVKPSGKNQEAGDKTTEVKPQRKKPGPKPGFKRVKGKTQTELAKLTSAPNSKTEAGDSRGKTADSKPKYTLAQFIGSSSTVTSPSPEGSPPTDSGVDSPTQSPIDNNVVNAAGAARAPSEPPFIPDPITIPDKYVPHRPMTNNQAIKLFDMMCERMDWHDKELYESVGLQNMFGNRRAAAERFYRKECRRILMEGLAEAEGRMVGAPSIYQPMEFGVQLPLTGRAIADTQG